MTESKTRADTLVVSDLHLGSELSLAEALPRVLDQFDFKRLVLNGDIFDHLDFGPVASMRLGKRSNLPYSTHRLTEGHFEALRYIRALAERGVEVVWIEGNHDEGLAKLFNVLMGVEVKQEYLWEHDGTRYLAIHGDQYDRFYREHRFISDISWAVYVFLQGIPSARRLCGFLKRSTKRYINALTWVRLGAAAHAKEVGADVVICGHTHYVELHEQDGVAYVNSGSWTEENCHVVSVGSGVRIHAFDKAGTPHPEPVLH